MFLDLGLHPDLSVKKKLLKHNIGAMWGDKEADYAFWVEFEPK